MYFYHALNLRRKSTQNRALPWIIINNFFHHLVLHASTTVIFATPQLEAIYANSTQHNKISAPQ